MILVNIKRIINDYVECNEFEIRIIKGKVKVYYYDKISHFSNDVITIIKDNKKVMINGDKLVIETMFKEFVVISGVIKSISLENYYE